LKKLWFEYGNTQRGRLNPYSFTYHSSNPNYDLHAYDRWGNYKPYPATDSLYNTDFPYVSQDPLQKAMLDANAASWSLSEIILPSGGKIKVDYESDDYGYVQHLPAMQMMSIVEPYRSSAGVNENSEFQINDSPKIRFKLEQAITGGLTEQQRREEVLKYLDRDRGQLYFKVKINLRKSSEDFYEYISGYADIDFGADMGLETDGAGRYAYGYFHLKKENANGKGFNPLSLRTWQHLRTNQPDLANKEKAFSKAEGTGDKVNQIKSMGSIFVGIRQMFEGFYRFCDHENWGREIMGGKSWVRLKSPDRIKYGGGLRVRQITMQDSWTEDKEGVYGQVYEYTTEESGEVISSGVAAYEPFIGGDEIPLRYAKKYTQSVPLRADNNLFFEYPVNESYYPGPQVGYSKVTVTSLAAASLAGKNVRHTAIPGGGTVFPTGEGVSYGTSGQTVHEFYTAKDFPVITDETGKDNEDFNLSIQIPFLGSIGVSQLTTSQGYSIVTNDMHGKPRKISNYKQDVNGDFVSAPVSWMKYNYLSDTTVYYQGKRVSKLTAMFKDNGDGTLRVATSNELNNPAQLYTLGQESEMFMDMRQFQDIAWDGGGKLDVDIVMIPILFAMVPVPIPTVWPDIGRSETTLRSSVMNKVIFRSGIVQSIEAYDAGSTTLTENLKWDKQTGQVVLTRVNNNFNNPVYSYSIPAYTQYQGMGAAYQNVGLTFAINSIQQRPYHDNLYQFATSMPQGNLYPGDEILLYSTDELKYPTAKVIYIGEEEGQLLLFSQASLSATDYKCLVARSGYRNQLTANAGSITALSDPSVGGTQKTYPKTIRVPVGNQ
jgi:hypothetical protein